MSDQKPQIILPKKAVAVVGHEFNLYYQNVIHCTSLNDYFVCCSFAPNPDRKVFNKTNTLVLSDCFRTTPPEGSEGTYAITIALRDKMTWETVVSASMTLEVISDGLKEQKNVLFLGDSLTEAAIIAAEIQHNLSGGKMIALGSRRRTVTLDGKELTVAHEGRSSWSAYDYTSEANCKDHRFSGEANVFYNPDTQRFDFSYYMKKQGYDSLDAVCINLGTNGAWVPDLTCEAMDEIIASIHAYDPKIKIIVCLIALGATQDGFALSTGFDSAAAFRMNARTLGQRYIQKYDGTMPNVSVAELYFCLDEINDYEPRVIPLSARNPGTRTVPGDNVHPNLYGYLKFADVCYNNLLYCLQDK